MAANSVPWFYLLHGRVYGPLTVEALAEYCWVHHVIDEDSLVWAPGLAEWRPLFELSKLIVISSRPLPGGISPEHILPLPPPSFPDPQLRWTTVVGDAPRVTGEPAILLARAARVSMTLHPWPEALYRIRRRLFLPTVRSACQLWIGPGSLAAVTLGLKRSIGILAYPFIGTIGIPTSKEEGGPLFKITSPRDVRLTIVDAWGPSFAFLALATSDSYIGITSLDYRAFEQPGENRKLIRTAARAYEALGLRPEIERRMWVFTERLYNQSFSAWAAQLFARAVP